MRLFLSLLLGLVSVSSLGATTTALVYHSDATNPSDTLTNAAGQASQINDLTANANQAVQATDADKPYRQDDGQGFPCWEFPRWQADGATGAKCNMVVPAGGTLSGISTRQCTIYVVCALDQQAKSQIMLSGPLGVGLAYFNTQPSGFTAPLLNMYGPNMGTSSPPMFVSCNRAVVSLTGGAASTIFRVNNNTLTGSAPVSTTFGTFAIGGNNSLTRTFYGRLYEILIYSQTHDTTTNNSIVSELLTKWNVNVSYDGVIVCRGDSITEGAFSNGGQSWVRYLMNRLGNRYRVYNLGISSSQFTNGNEGMSNDSTIADLLRDPSVARNALLELEGRNDVSANSAAVVKARLVAWATARNITWSPSEIYAMTLLDSGSLQSTILTYNGLLKAGDPSYSNFIDFGLGSTFTYGFNTAVSHSNLTYYNSDGTHLQEFGEDQLARMVAGPFTGVSFQHSWIPLTRKLGGVR